VATTLAARSVGDNRGVFATSGLYTAWIRADQLGMSHKDSFANSSSSSPLPAGELPNAVEGFSRLAGSLNRMLDLSVRDVISTLRDVDNCRESGQPDALSDLSEKLTRATENLQAVSELVAVAMQGASVPIGSSFSAARRPIDLSQSVAHACDVIRQQFNADSLQFVVELPPAVAGLPSGALYAAILGAVRHGATSIHNAGGKGTLHIWARLKSIALPTHTYEAVELFVEDDGAGPLDADERRDVGLELCGAVVHDAGGVVEVRKGDGRYPRHGSSVTIRVPKPVDWSTTSIGKKAS
jgi:hypothetical protein